MGISRAETAKRDKLIIAALERGTPPDVIARETGAGIASVYRKRQVWLQARSDKAVAGLYVGEDILDIPEPPIMAVLDAAAPDFGLAGKDVSRRRLERLAAKADALERMRLFRPSQWAKLVTEEEAQERQVALDLRLPRETWAGFFGEVVSHQSGLLTESDMMDWIRWVAGTDGLQIPNVMA